MQVINLGQNSIALSSSYMGDDDIELLKSKVSTEDGLVFFHENYLNEANDRRINNYSSLVLTKKDKLDNLLDLTRLDYNKPDYFTTSISDATQSYYMTVSALSASTHNIFFSLSGDSFIDETDRHFEVQILSSGSLSAKIIHRWYGSVYYLTYDGVFSFSKIFNQSKSIFRYSLDEESNKLALFYGNSAVCFSDGSLILSANVNFTKNYFNINYYIQELTPRLNTSWVSYNKDKKNSYEVDASKSRNDLKNNYLITSQYSYVKGDEIKVNILTLKNQNTHKNYTNRADYGEMRNDNVPNVDMRQYNSLMTGNDQEKGEYNITLGYEFYNMDYKFEADKYTVFNTPSSLYPYNRINVNDLNWHKTGSIAGESPYTSDRIYRKKINDGSSDGEYICTWLKCNTNGSYTWLDRYYYPEKTSYAAGLSTTFSDSYTDPILKLINTGLSASEYYDVPYVYNSVQEEYANTPQTPKSALYGIAFFDKKSDLVMEANSEYIYYRIGSDYTKIVLDTLKEFLIQSGLSITNMNDANVIVSGDEYVFDGTIYSKFQGYSAINVDHQFTLAFWLKSDDWTTKFGHQILGNMNDKGFAIYSDRKVTPIITIQSGKDVYTYNTNFQKLDDASLSNENLIDESKIKNIYRTDHLDSFYTLTID